MRSGASSPSDWFRAIFLLLFTASGGAALAYQIVWVKILGTGLGHEMPAVLAVVTAFFGGMALGAWWLHGPIERSAHPVKWYAGLEALIGIWGLILSWLLPRLNLTVVGWIGLDPSPLRHWLVALCVPGLALLPATAALGATFPAMERSLAAFWPGSRCVGAVYAVNTFGGALGGAAAVFVLAPTLGFRATLWTLAAVNFCCAAVAAGWRRIEGESSRPRAAGVPARRWWLGGLLWLTGLLGIGYEVVGVRILSQVLQNTIYTFVAVLAVYLVGTAAGAAFYHRWGRGREFQVLLRALLGGLALSIALEMWVFQGSASLYEALRRFWPDSLAGAALAEMSVAGAVFGLPTMFMGALFSHLAQAYAQVGGGVGRAVALNTVGGALAGGLFGVILFPVLGASWALVILVLGYACLLFSGRGWPWGCLALLAALLVPRPLRFIDLPPGGRVVLWKEGVMATVAVLEEPGGERTLRVDNRFQMGGTRAASAEYRQAHLPLLLHPAPGRALFLGLGTGITLGAAVLHPNLHSDGVELVPEVVGSLGAFEPANRGVRAHPATSIFVADARRFVRNCSGAYDVVVGDVFHPARDGAGSLYSREHYEAVGRVLAPGGIFCQWLPLHQIDTTTLRSIIRTFLGVFPDAQAWLLRLNVDAPVLGLVAGAFPPAPGWVEGRTESEPLREELRRLALADSVRLFGCWVAGPDSLRVFAGGAPMHTDDSPHVTFGAPRLAYRQQARAYESLLRLLESPAEGTWDAPASGQFSGRVWDYLLARNVYLRGLVDETEGRLPLAMEAYVESARLSADFTSGYARVLTFATSFARARPEEVQRLLKALIDARPNNPVAFQLLQKLFPESI